MSTVQALPRVSVEDQAAADDRIPELLDTPAAVRFLSCEPLLEPVDLEPWLRRVATSGPGWRMTGGSAMRHPQGHGGDGGTP